MESQKLLTILILTHNRKAEVSHLLRVLGNFLEDFKDVEVVVSDNSDQPLELEFQSPMFTTFRPAVRFKTAEQHLFYAVKQVSGTYIWPLGDDDIPTRDGIETLIEMCEKGTWDAMTWNARNVGVNSEAIGWSRVFCRSGFLEISYADFITRMGFWSIPAGLSLTVFRRELVTEQIIRYVETNESPIYSHVAAFSLAFKDAKFAFINTDLVQYRTNSHDAVRDGNHWGEYSRSQETFYRYPWTLGFIKHLKLLQAEDAISSDYLARAIDVSHFGSRFMLLDVVIDLFLEQLIMDIMHESKIPMKSEQVYEIIDYLEIAQPSATEIWKIALSTPDAFSKSRLERSGLAARLHLLRKILIDNQTLFPYQRFYRGAIDGHLIYDTPLGRLQFPPYASPVRRLRLVEYLNTALQGIEFPAGFDDSLESHQLVKSGIVTQGDGYRNAIYSREFLEVGELYPLRRRVISKKLILYFYLPRKLRSIAKRIYLRVK